MAVSLGGTGQYLRRTTSLPTTSAWTLAGWFRVRSIRASQYQYFIDLDDGTNYAVIGYQAAGGWDFGTSAGAGSMTGPSTNVWTFIACTLAGAGAGNFKVYHAAAGAAFTVGSSAGATFTPTGMYIGNDSWDEWCNVDIAHVRVWDAVLTQAELEQEIYTARPARFANLHLWSPLWTPSDVVDYSGNGRNWAVGGTLATVDGPPIAWGARSWVVPWVAAAATGTGTLTATLAAATLTGAGTAAVQATLTGALGAATLSAGATVASTGALTATLSAATLSATGSVVSTGVAASLTATLAPATLTSTGSAAVAGALTKTLAAATLSATGTAPVQAALTGTLAAATLASNAYRHTSATAGGVLTTSGRYFATSSTGALVLAGFHTWADVQDTASSYPPAAFDWPAYLAALVARGANYTKLWMMESARDWGDASPLYFAPLPWARTGPGNAADGQPKFDLSKFDERYFDRLQARAIEAGNAGVYVCVQLFQGWHVESKGLTYNPWTYHPFNAANNVNGVNGDANADGKGLETRLTTSTAIYNLQKAYVSRVIEAVGHLDNVIFEISNEDHNDSWDWQVALMGYIRTVESGRPKQHLVGLTVLWPTSNNSQLAASGADWVSYADTDTTPDANTSGPLSAYDTDHNPNLFTTGRAWIWQALTRGHAGLWLMDHWAGETYGTDYRSNSAWNLLRSNLGYALTWARRLALAGATAQGNLASTGYCLAVTTGRYQLLAYQDGSGSFTVNLSSLGGTFTLEWLRPSTGATSAGSNVTGGAVRTLTPPWSGEDAVALLELAGSSGDVTATLGAAALSATAAVTVGGALAKTLAPATLTGVAAVTVQASITTSLGAATVSASGVVAVTGALTKTPAAATLSASGAVAVTATVTATLGAATLSASGTATVGGALATTLPPATLSASAAVMVQASVAATLTAATLTASGTVGNGNSGTVTATLAAATLAATATVTVQATTSIALGTTTLTSTATVAVTATLTATLASATLDAYGGSGSGASVAATLSAATLAASGTVAVTGAATLTLAPATLASSAAVAVEGALGITLGAATIAALSSVAVQGALTTTLAAATLTAGANVENQADVSGTLVATLHPATLTAAAIVVYVAVLAGVSGPGSHGRVVGPGGPGAVRGPKSTSSTGG